MFNLKINWNVLLVAASVCYVLSYIACAFLSRRIHTPFTKRLVAVLMGATFCCACRPVMLLAVLPYPIWTISEYLINVHFLGFIVVVIFRIFEKHRDL